MAKPSVNADLALHAVSSQQTDISVAVLYELCLTSSAFKSNFAQQPAHVLVNVSS